LQSTVAEVVTVEAHQARAYSIMPVVWCIGSIAGSAIGGILADPVRNYGWSAGSIWAKYPFLLPNVFCTGIVVLGMIVGVLFLDETHEDKKHERDRGLECGKWLLSLVTSSPATELSSRKRDYVDETFTLMHEDIDCPPGYKSTASSPALSPSAAPVGLPPPAYQSIEGSPRNSLDEEALAHIADATKRNSSLSNAFTKQVNLIIVSYGIMA
jgi:MFS family permease